MPRRCSMLFGLSLLIAPVLIAQQGASTDADKGKRLFIQNGCFECHGYVGQGGASGPRIAPWTSSPESLISYVRRPAGQMPLYTERVLSRADLMMISAYLKNLPAPKSGKEIPLLSNAESK